MPKTPSSKDVCTAFDPTKERIRHQNYIIDQKLREMK